MIRECVRKRDKARLGVRKERDVEDIGKREGKREREGM